MSGANGHADFVFSTVQGILDEAPAETTFRRFMSEIRDGQWRKPIERLRAVHDEAAAKARAAGLTGRAFRDAVKTVTTPIKIRLPGACFSGTFSYRDEGHLLRHSGLICADLDHLDERVESVRDMIVADPHCLGCVISPTGTGLKVIFRIDPERPHLESFHATRYYVLEYFGLEIDNSCKDVNRLCFVTYDPDAFIADHAEVLPYPPPIENVQVPESVRSELVKDFPAGFVSPLDAYNATDKWKGLLRRHGWIEAWEPYWRRPGKEGGVSASWNVVPNHFHLFTDSAPNLKPDNYTPAALFAFLECGGNFKQAADAIYDMGLGTRRKPKPKPKQAEEVEELVWDTPLRTLSSFTIPPDDDRSILLGDRYLSRGDGAILSGTSGIGKSSIGMQKAVHWALGQPAFDIKPNGPLRSLIFQSEDSDGDVAEIWESMRRALKLSAQDVALVDLRVKVVSERVARGALFIGALERAIKSHQPDLVWINPLQAFIDCDITDSQELGGFLRGELNRLNTPAAFAYILIHHTTKPATGTNRQERLWHEVMYDMAGGAELINWARAIISLRPASQPGEFNLILAKRGVRAGVTKRVPQGAGFRIESVTTIPIKHSSGRFEMPGVKRGLPVIHWLPRDPDPEPEGSSDGRKTKYDYQDFRNLMPAKASRGLEIGPLWQMLQTNGNIGEKKNLGSVMKRWRDEGWIEIIADPGVPMRYRAVV